MVSGEEVWAADRREGLSIFRSDIVATSIGAASVNSVVEFGATAPAVSVTSETKSGLSKIWSGMHWCDE
jgi:hypothetical protein